MRPDFPPRPEPPVPVAISACLTGEAVRYDGSDAADALPHRELAGVFDYAAVCPEVGIGMGVPRPPIRLVGEGGELRAVGVDDPGLDVTDALSAFGRRQAVRLKDVCGYIFMTRSPNCGLDSVKVRAEVRGEPQRLDGQGVYASSWLREWPSLPVEENERLFDPARRGTFINRTLAYAHWRCLEQGGLTAQRLIEFHARYKYLLMAHSVNHYRAAGQMLSDLRAEVKAVGERYLACLMAGLARPADRAGHANALFHMQGYLKRRMGRSEAESLTRAIDGCRTGALPVAEACAQLLCALERHPNAYLRKQAYLDAVRWV
ncbi:MAG: DUF1722 domain-containing protein [Gammaproteobacteria bacterium]|nr:DUF1722 domain-containing protein [Gammaproteobacteria bacterium]MDE0270924.1 DUF1722 domain-containing protein [Gammaproteobacteria bacterium]